MKDEKSIATKEVDSSTYDHSISQKIKEFDERVSSINKTVDDLFDLTEKMLLDIGEIK